MPRAPRFAPRGYVYHALKRAVARLPLFEKAGDFAAFEHVMVEAQARCPIRILGYCLLPNHGRQELAARKAAEKEPKK
jgi:putative transposase